MNVFGNAGFDGKSFAEMRAVIPEAVDEKRIRKAVAQLIKESLNMSISDAIRSTLPIRVICASL